jgi:hypothetical protein
MGEIVKAADSKPTVFPWGEGIADLRYFNGSVLLPSEVDAYERQSYKPTAVLFAAAVDAIHLALKDAPPGIYWAGNPLYGDYGKWSCALQAAGFTKVDGCATNRVYASSPQSKRALTNAHPERGTPTKTPWESTDGYTHWIHAFYIVKPGFKGKLKFDFSKRTPKPTTGDDNNSLWQIGYGGRDLPPATSEYTRYGWQGGGAGPKNFLSKFARMSKNCGIAMGDGLPECGKWLDEEFFTVATLPEGEAFPKGWTEIVSFAGTTFAHNLLKLDTSQTPCPHNLEVKL